MKLPGGIGLALATTKDPAVAVTLAILIGQTFGLIFYNTRMALYSFWNRRAQTAAEINDDRGIVMNHLVLPQITTFLVRAIPVSLAIYFGRGLVDWLLSSVPQTITDIISVLGGVLPALGIAMLMNIVIKEKIQLIFFFVGFVLIAFADLSMIAVVFLAALVAYIVYLAAGKKTTATDNTAASSTTDSDVYEDEDLF
ncbi:hypothetical protein WJ7_18410 [Tetragenococcus halophilus]|nr:hypothetical protein WJ7_18410 [Tetragenococcus halophilus]